MGEAVNRKCHWTFRSSWCRIIALALAFSNRSRPCCLSLLRSRFFMSDRRNFENQNALVLMGTRPRPLCRGNFRSRGVDR
ncbi:hypothetical protein BDV37DRAFT_253706 [Aspergillus pseudonomiae]|uniref:Secreted protein n=1 Tax=Aspergillus pseudonomiae TaxID=1506151 RepID=A0A5N7D7N7_9EURO|nr:uncharacterized protein BDV37DRAFT_253706 [Aspergillus pseudonomiae]KAE8401963.1 hypothetical protein BDV37DRAFT_253706 [Aspergillus pseudonomiae]